MDITNHPERGQHAAPLVVYCIFRQVKNSDPLPRDDITSIWRLNGKGTPDEQKSCIGWLLDSWTFRIYFPTGKVKQWISDLRDILRLGKVNAKTNASLVALTTSPISSPKHDTLSTDYVHSTTTVNVVHNQSTQKKRKTYSFGWPSSNPSPQDASIWTISPSPPLSSPHILKRFKHSLITPALLVGSTSQFQRLSTSGIVKTTITNVCLIFRTNL